MVNKAVAVGITDTRDDQRYHVIWARGKRLDYRGVLKNPPNEEDYLANISDINKEISSELGDIIEFYEIKIPDMEDLAKKELRNEKLEKIIKGHVKELYQQEYI